MRLIDADEVLEILKFYETEWQGISWAIREIKELPTAYDPDKVVEQLCKKTHYVETYEYGREAVIKLFDAIEIVKKGGAV